MNKTNRLIPRLLIFLCACIPGTVLAQIPQISLPSKVEGNDIRVSDISREIEYVMLEATKEYPITRIHNMLLTPVSILILDHPSQNLRKLLSQPVFSTI